MNISAVAKAYAVPIISSLTSILEDSRGSDERFLKEIEVNIENHLREVINWSERIQQFGMYKPNYTDEKTVDLSFGIPRKFRSISKNEIEEEQVLLDYPDHLLILGDPGAGKTTTLKKLSRKILFVEILDNLVIFWS